MARACSVCAHPELRAIDHDLVGGESHTAVAERFGLGPASVHRHRAAHLPRLLQEAARAKRVELGGSLLEQLTTIRNAAWDILHEAWAKGAHRDAIAAARECRATLETLGRATGELAPDQHRHLHLAVGEQLVAQLGTYVDQLEELGAPKRTLDTPILSGKAALPTAAQLRAPRDEVDSR